MAHRGAIWVVCAATLLTQIACEREQTDAHPTVPSNQSAQRVITLVKVSDKPADIIEEYQPVADHLAASISDFDIGWVQAAGDLETMAQWLVSGNVGIYFDNIYPSMVVAELRRSAPDRGVEVTIDPGVEVVGDPTPLRVVLLNLLENAWKFTGKQQLATIEFGVTGEESDRVFYIRDNGVDST